MNSAKGVIQVYWWEYEIFEIVLKAVVLFLQMRYT